MNRTFFSSYRTFFALLAVCICFFVVLGLEVMSPFVQVLDSLDKRTMLTLNYDAGPAADRFWYSISSNMAWVPLGATLLASLAYYKKSVLAPLMIVLGLAVTVVLADQISSSIIKEVFTRLRPSHCEEICGFLHHVNNYKGGQYGFVSSHAANAFGVFAFLAPMFRYKTTIFVLFLWSCLVCYSRIYLGVHYLGDVVGGGLVGLTVGFGVSLVFRSLYFRIVGMRKVLSDTNGRTYTFESQPITITVLCTCFYFLFYSFNQLVPVSLYGIMLYL